MNRSRSWYLLLFLCSLAFVERAGVVIAPKADLYGRSANDDLRIKVNEEIARGNIAADLLDGTLVPLIDYQYAPFFGGSLIVGILTAPVFALFGPTLWALKLVPILIHLAGLVVLFHLLGRHVSPRAALLGGLLWALTPPGYTLLSTVNWGSHIESNVLALLALSLHLDLARPEHRGRRRLGLGLLFGFSLYFGYQCALFIIVLSVFDLARSRRPNFHEAGLELLGAVVGFTPWLIYNLRHAFTGLRIYNSSLSGHTGAEDPGVRLVRLLTETLPHSMFTGTPVLDYALFVLFTLLALAGVILPGVDGQRARPALLAAVYGTLFVTTYTFSDFRMDFDPDLPMGYRYVMLLAPWVVVAAACGLDALAQHGTGAARFTYGVAVIVATTSFLATWIVACDYNRFGADRDEPGVNLASHGCWLCMRFIDEPERVPDLVERILRRSPEDQETLFQSMGTFLSGMGRVRRGMSTARSAEAERMRRLAAVLRDAVPEQSKAAFRAPPRHRNR